jgi:WD40 repeat protein
MKLRHRIKIILFLTSNLIMSALYTACGGPGTDLGPTPSTVVPEATEMAMNTATSRQVATPTHLDRPHTSTPVEPTKASSPEQTSTIEPTPISSTILPPDLQIIAPRNIAHLRPLARFTINLGGYPPSEPVFSPNGQILGVASSRGEVILWDLEQGNMIETLNTLFGSRSEGLMEGGFVTHPSFAFSPDSRFVAAVMEDSTSPTSDVGAVAVWELDLIGERRVLEPSGLMAASVAFSPEGNLLAIGTKDCFMCGLSQIVFYEFPSCEEIRAIEVEGEGVKDLAFTQDGRTIIASGHHGTVGQWDVDSGELVAETGKPMSYQIDISPDGNMLAIDNGSVWDLNTGEMIVSLEATQMIFSPDGRMLAALHDDLWFLDLTTWDLLHGLHTEERIQATTFSPDGRILATVSEHGIVQLWGIPAEPDLHHASLLLEPENVGEIQILAQHVVSNATDVIFSQNGVVLAIGHSNGKLSLWDTNLIGYLREFHRHTDWVYRLAFKGGTAATLASASKDGTLRIWGFSSLGTPLVGHDGEVTCVDFSPTEFAELASGSEDQTVKIWNIFTEEELRTLSGHTNWVWGVAYSPDGSLLASASADETVKIWNAEAGQELLALRGHEAAVWQVNFSPDGGILASASWDDTVKLWDVSSGAEIQMLSGHSDWVYDIDFSINGRILASGSKDGMVILWDVVTGEQLTVLRGHSAAIRGVDFSPDGHFLATISEDGRLNIWGLQP